MRLHCCGCNNTVYPRLTDGAEVYPHRQDLHALPFWKCDICENFVGCHYKTKDRTRPLGCIPTKELKEARKHIHSILDPIWQSGKMKRKAIYKRISDAVGWEYHTAKIRNIEEARKIYRLVKEIQK